MARVILWNSVATRRRSISDTFYDNGLGTLKGYLEEKGHSVEIIDWARDDFFASLGNPLLSRLLRVIYAVLLSGKVPFLGKVLGACTLFLQAMLSRLQHRKFDRKLRLLVEDLIAREIRVLGVKIWYGEAFSNAKRLVQMIKEKAPEIITVAGGYHVTLYEERILQQSGFDLAVSCEGELALDLILNMTDAQNTEWNKAQVMQGIADLAGQGKFENLIYRQDGKIVKTPRREARIHSSKSVPRYIMDPDKVSIHVMVESLGCDWGKCHFCVHSHFYPQYSLRDPQEVVYEMQRMREAGIGIFRFAGSDTPPAFGARIAREIRGREVKAVFGMGSRAIRGARERFEQLAESYAELIYGGMRAVFMGGETGNDLINDEVMNKGVNFEDLVWSIRALREAQKRTGEKVYLSLALIFPAPLMGKVTLEKVAADNMSLLRETMPDSVMITPPGPFLHTKWYDQKDVFGFKVDDTVITSAMEYEYVLYKPPHLWPSLDITLEGKSFKVLLEECNRFRNSVEKELGIPTDISDEHFLMFYGAGLRSKEEIAKAKKETMLDIISCDYRYTAALSKKVNAFSRALADSGGKL
jgi:hypothetical protein